MQAERPWIEKFKLPVRMRLKKYIYNPYPSSYIRVGNYSVVNLPTPRKVRKLLPVSQCKTRPAPGARQSLAPTRPTLRSWCTRPPSRPCPKYLLQIYLKFHTIIAKNATYIKTKTAAWESTKYETYTGVNVVVIVGLKNLKQLPKWTQRSYT